MNNRAPTARQPEAPQASTAPPASQTAMSRSDSDLRISPDMMAIISNTIQTAKSMAATTHKESVNALVNTAASDIAFLKDSQITQFSDGTGDAITQAFQETFGLLGAAFDGDEAHKKMTGAFSTQLSVGIVRHESNLDNTLKKLNATHLELVAAFDETLTRIEEDPNVKNVHDATDKGLDAFEDLLTSELGATPASAIAELRPALIEKATARLVDMRETVGAARRIEGKNSADGFYTEAQRTQMTKDINKVVASSFDEFTEPKKPVKQ